MSAGASRTGAPAATSPWLIAVVVAFATFMEVLDTTIANVALPYIAGGLGVSEDEASWVVTTYLVSNAVALTASSFVARWLGRKSFFLICLALFTVSSVLCGFAWNLQSLLLFRILQGLGGGGMVPVSQSILADSFPPEKRGQGFAMFGVAVVVAPVVGPTLGGCRGASTTTDGSGRIRCRRLCVGCDLSRRARDRARPRPGGRLVLVALHRRIRRHQRHRIHAHDSVGD